MNQSSVEEGQMGNNDGGTSIYSNIDCVNAFYSLSVFNRNVKKNAILLKEIRSLQKHFRARDYNQIGSTATTEKKEKLIYYLYITFISSIIRSRAVLPIRSCDSQFD
jgi:hypothetical protein